MQIYQFKKEVGKKNSKFDSNFVMSRIMQTKKVTHIGCIHLEKDGVVGYHQAVVPQLLLIVEGEGWVRGETDDYINVQSGEAVFWSQGEWHETKTDTGLTAIVIESEELDTSSLVSV